MEGRSSGPPRACVRGPLGRACAAPRREGCEKKRGGGVAPLLQHVFHFRDRFSVSGAPTPPQKNSFSTRGQGEPTLSLSPSPDRCVVWTRGARLGGARGCAGRVPGRWRATATRETRPQAPAAAPIWRHARARERGGGPLPGRHAHPGYSQPPLPAKQGHEPGPWGLRRRGQPWPTGRAAGSYSPAARALVNHKKNHPLAFGTPPPRHARAGTHSTMISKRAVILALVAALVATQGEWWIVADG